MICKYNRKLEINLANCPLSTFIRKLPSSLICPNLNSLFKDFTNTRLHPILYILSWTRNFTLTSSHWLCLIYLHIFRKSKNFQKDFFSLLTFNICILISKIEYRWLLQNNFWIKKWRNIVNKFEFDHFKMFWFQTWY